MVRVEASPLLIVEDSDEDFDTALAALKHAGIDAKVHRAHSGGECIDLLRAATPLRPAIVFMDLNTPGVDGREALGDIKSDAQLKRFPVVVLSTSADPRDLAECYDAGANAYHVKPVRYHDHLVMMVALFEYWAQRVALPLGNLAS